MKHLFKYNKKITSQNLGDHLFQKQLDYIGKTVKEVKNDPEWYLNNKLTKAQYNEWKEYCIEAISKTYQLNERQAELEFNWLDLGYGLTIED
jgi:hypothetical protein